MELVSVAASIVHLVLLLYIFVLFARLILDYIPLFNREWRPKGFGLVAAEAVYTVTDPPIRFFRRLIPPLRIGSLSLDFGFTLTLLIVLVLMNIVRLFIR
ncbi:MULTISPECIES: YggT family protein [Microbacterium]|uniref:YggT family protein n=1 Tax=Microbacterium aurugineum TaxID=2851642 RepID=A0ABY4IZX8_9MICO|nr:MULTISPECIES: YggT family protein [Microbacterium]PKQ33199.1 MAG: YggT family protein [Actinobacteria bacterium HGW-Actinobacteria-11]MCE0507496.1 YggT family protein [Microbacterium sp. KKR3/1]MCK8465650.1 YggT family protein [Microbacterium aurugineum]MCK8477942.1 YggT family protein [Microbacterium aurugineum]MCZ4302742.1 YggT family protein [Microbacterium oxydans]